MDAKTFFQLVSNMRSSQKEYFKTRSSQALKKSKELEKKVDDEIKRVNAIQQASIQFDNTNIKR